MAVAWSTACATQPRGKPYLREVGRRDNLSVWLVDGAYVRSNIDIEFTNFGQHYVFKFIPENELWLDEEAQHDEQEFFIEHLVVERALMARGVSYDSATGVAERIELAERKIAGDVAKVTRADGSLDASRAHIALLATTPDSVSEWIVDGRLVRSAFDIEFTEGGHDRVYDYVPKNEIWIDNDLTPAERPFVLLHELHERHLMGNGWTYESAHADANRVEAYDRHHPSELLADLAREAQP